MPSTSNTGGGRGRPPAPPPPARRPDMFAVWSWLSLAGSPGTVRAFDPKAEGPRMDAALTASLAGAGERPGLVVERAVAELVRRRHELLTGLAPPEGFPRVEIILDEVWLVQQLRPAWWRGAWLPARVRAHRLHGQIRRLCALGRPVNVHVCVASDHSCCQPPAQPFGRVPARCAIRRRRHTSPGG